VKIVIEIPDTSVTKKVSGSYVRERILTLLEAIYAVSQDCITVSIKGAKK